MKTKYAREKSEYALLVKDLMNFPSQAEHSQIMVKLATLEHYIKDQGDDLKSEVDKLKKNQSKRKVKRENGTSKSKVNRVAEAVEDVMNVLSDDVLPYAKDLKHLHETNKEHAKDTTLG